ncbi:RHS repeat-associated core domain-containing protein [uncultured Bacteroides sp.]|uniref:RHS repeat-associated core domain-containing protein n=1 Tax=uncultured Bacteroides sp. TaxID=162156 RepID=UPI0034285850
MTTYEYDTWGKLISSSGSLADINPLRYRGYYYDTETGFYYLQNRCYSPVVCRFINGVKQTPTGAGIVGYNMFAYCHDKFGEVKSYGYPASSI